MYSDMTYYLLIVFNVVAIFALLYNSNAPRGKRWLEDSFYHDSGHVVILCLMFVFSFVPLAQLIVFALLFFICIFAISRFAYNRANRNS